MGTETNNELTVIRKERPPCPFYGFNHVHLHIIVKSILKDIVSVPHK